MSRRTGSDFFAPPHPRIFAHRGFSSAFPENTIPAFKGAVTLGIPFVELDVRATRDGEIVLSHDDDLARISGRPGSIAALTFAEVRAFDAGWSFTLDGGATYPWRARGLRVPRLSEVLESCPTLRVLIEVKPENPALVPKLIRAVKDAGAQRRVLVASEHQKPIGAVRELAPDIPTNCPAPEIADFLQAMARGMRDYAPAADALQIPPEYEGWKFATRESVAAAHGAGLEVHVWTIDDELTMRAMLDIGVDGILTNVPDRLQKILAGS